MSIILKTFWALIQRDMLVFWPTYKDRVINSLLWATISLLVFDQVMPSLGLSSGYAAFLAASNIASWGFFDVMENVAKTTSDIEGERSISYYLTLPIPQWMVFFRIGIANALSAFFVVLMFVPITKIILWNKLSFGQISFVKLFIILVLTNLFYGLFSLYLAAKTENLDKITNIWMRVIFPLWFLGCYQFPWYTLKNVAPVIAYIDLFNPLVYIMEGTRAALIGQEGALNFWYCVLALCIFCTIAGYVGIKKMKKRLDCL